MAAGSQIKTGHQKKNGRQLRGLGAGAGEGGGGVVGMIVHELYSWGGRVFMISTVGVAGCS